MTRRTAALTLQAGQGNDMPQLMYKVILLMSLILRDNFHTFNVLMVRC